MGQEIVFDFLCKYKEQWFTVVEINKELPCESRGSINKAVQKLALYGFIIKKENDYRYYKECFYVYKVEDETKEINRNKQERYYI